MQVLIETIAYLCNYLFMGNKQTICCPDLKDLSPLFKAMGDPNRMAILERLCNCSDQTNVKELSTCCDVDLSVVSRHLSILKKSGILKAEKKGKEVFYSVNSKELATALRSIADYIEKSCKMEEK